MDMLHAMLKSVGNMGDVANDLQPSILRCIKAENPMQHRLTAIRALRKMKLHQEVKLHTRKQ